LKCYKSQDISLIPYNQTAGHCSD